MNAAPETAPAAIRVLLVCLQPLLGDGIERILRQVDDIQVTVYQPGGPALAAAAAACQAEVIVIAGQENQPAACSFAGLEFQAPGAAGCLLDPAAGCDTGCGHALIWIGVQADRLYVRGRPAASPSAGPRPGAGWQELSAPAHTAGLIDTIRRFSAASHPTGG